MKKCLTYLMLSSLLFTNIQTAHAITKEMLINGLKSVGTKTVTVLSPVGRGCVLVGQKLNQNKKLAFVTMGITVLTGTSLYLNSEKVKDKNGKETWKPATLFGKNKSFNPFTSNFARKIFNNISDIFSILRGKSSSADKIKKEKDDISNKYTNDTAQLNQNILTLNEQIENLTNEKENIIKNSNQLHQTKDSKIDNLNKNITTLTEEKNKLDNTITELKNLHKENLKEKNCTN